AYLRNPGQSSIRQFSFTQLGIGIFGTPLTAPPIASCVPNRSWPCVPGSQCVEGLIETAARCDDNAGTWYGPPDNCANPDHPCDPPCPPPTVSCTTSSASQKITNCCDYINCVNPSGTISPIQQYAVRNRYYKLVRLDLEDCTAPIDPSTPPNQRPF